MPRLALAKDFLAAYAQLDKPVRKAVEAAIGKFAEHTHAGMHLEKLENAADPRIRTVRIDRFWRGVVLAPDAGDLHCLVTVLPHDDAIAYAKSRRFSVNQALGVLEVRNQQAIELMEPALRTLPATREPLFAGVSDADLRRLGVDPQLLPVVRLLTAEAHLEALANVLPEAQYDALVALAAGMTAEEVWGELAAQLVTDGPPAAIDPDDITAAAERTPGRIAVVSGPEELASILAHPFAAWRVFLHPAQRKIAFRPSYSGPAMVTGGAGSGKTVTALHRAAYLARRWPGGGPADAPGGSTESPPILLTTFTRNLAETLQQQLAMLIGENGENAVLRLVDVVNVDRVAHRTLRAARGGQLPVVGSDALAELWRQAAHDTGGAFLAREWEQVVLAQDIRDVGAYLACSRAGRGVALGRSQREQVWRAIGQVTGSLRAAGTWTHLQIAAEAARAAASSGRPPYRHVIVDEAQDLHPAQWRLLRALAPAGPDDIFLVGDPHQRIYDHRASLAALGINVRGRSRRLTLSYRTTEEILSWAIPILGLAPLAGIDDEPDTLAGYRSPLHGRRPVLRRCGDRREELDELVATVQEWLRSGVEPHAIGVAARTGHLVRGVQEALRATGIHTKGLTDQPAEAVRVGTMHRMKGLEFQCVAIVGVSAGIVPSPRAVTPAAEDRLANAADLQRERCLLFVACTRARDRLYVSYSGTPSRFLPGQAERA